MTGSVVDVIAHLWMEAGKKVFGTFTQSNRKVKVSSDNVSKLICVSDGYEQKSSASINR